MGRYILKRALTVVPLFFIISFLSFGMINISKGDVASSVIYASGITQITESLLAETREELGLNAPFLTRYFNWLKSCASLDFGISYVYKKPVSGIIAAGFLNTVHLAFASICVIIVMSLILGILCAMYAGSLFDKLIRAFMFIFSAMPVYWIGTLLIWAVSVKLNLLPVSGKDGWANFILPVFVLSLNYFAYYLRIVRSEMLQNMHEDYVLYSKSCGLREKTMIVHILRNSLQITVSGLCLAVPSLLAGTVVVENVFAWPGIGRLCVSAVFSQDIPIIQAYVVILSTCFAVFNLFSDIINAALNPRLRGA
jgi:nickel transport system permease protein